MTDVLRTALGLIAAVAPFGALPVFMALAGAERVSPVVARAAIGGAAVAFAVLVAAAFVADPFLDFLDVSPEPFRFAAGAVMAPLAVRLLLTGDSMPVPREEDRVRHLWWLVPVAFPLLANPPAIVGTMSYATRFGDGDAIGGAAIALAITAVVLAAGPWLRSMLRPVGVNALGRLSGALLIVVAVELAIDGVRSV
jgi:small neutral amino acid transporter SnatA (MarC family)